MPPGFYAQCIDGNVHWVPIGTPLRIDADDGEYTVHAPMPDGTSLTLYMGDLEECRDYLTRFTHALMQTGIPTVQSQRLMPAQHDPDDEIRWGD